MPTAEKTAYLVDALTDAALGLFKHYGYKKTSVDEIAGKLHISKKTIYELFSSKEELLSEALWRDTREAIQTFVKTLPHILPPERLLMSFCRYVYLDCMRPEEEREFWALYHVDPHVRTSGWNVIKRVIGGIYSDGVKAGRLRRVQVALAAETVTAMVKAAVDRHDTFEDKTRAFGDSLLMISGAIASPGDDNDDEI